MIPDSDPYKPSDPETTAKAAQQLQQLPALEDSEAQLQSVIEQIAAAASELVPGLEWEWQREGSRKDCSAPYDQTNGRKKRLPYYVSKQHIPIPDNVWPQFLERARSLAATVGATAPETMQDENSTNSKPGTHDVWFSNHDDGTVINVGIEVNSVITGTTGCRLPRDQFNTPIEPPP